MKVEIDQFVICLVLFENLFAKFVAFHPWTMKRIVMLSPLFHCFSLFLPHLRTLAQGKRSENCLGFGTGGPSLCLYPLFTEYIIFPLPTMAACAKKKILAKRFAQTISVHYWDFECTYVY